MAIGPLEKILEASEKKFGLNQDCKIIPGTGDNPSSLIGLGIVAPGKMGISLGTSDTLFAHMSEPNTDPSGESHVFGSPAGDYMVLSCYKNGSLARESIKEEFDLSWEEFGDMLEQGTPGNNGRVFLPYFESEIIPKILKPGIQKFSMDKATSAQTVQAVVEAQMTSMAIHSEWLGETPKTIYVTGGASSNKAILQIMANVFNAKVAKQNTTNAAGLGAALRAHQAYNKSTGQNAEWEMIVSEHVPSDENAMIKPVPEAVAQLRKFREIYRKKESEYRLQVQ